MAFTLKHLDSARIEELRDVDGGNLLNTILNHLYSDIEKLHDAAAPVDN